MTIKSRLTLATAALAVATSLQSAPAAASSNPYIGEMMLVGFNYCPRGFAKAEGQLVAITQFPALYSLLGTTYGGDGRSMFGLPDMRGRSPIGIGAGAGLSNIAWGQRGGAESVTRSEAQMPGHTHLAETTVTADVKARGNTVAATARSPSGNVPALSPQGTPVYGPGPANADMDASAIQASVGATTTLQRSGGSQGFDNRDPYLGMVWCISLEGVFPPRP